MQNEQLDYTLGSQYGIPMVLRGNAVLFALEHGLTLVQACAQQQYGILGIDSFQLREEVLQPSIILDLSELYRQMPWAEFQVRSCEVAREFLQQLDVSVDLLEFVLADQ